MNYRVVLLLLYLVLGLILYMNYDHVFHYCWISLHHDTILPTDCLMVKHLNNITQSVGKEFYRQTMCVGESPVGNNLYRHT
jgi:hypothetical protein